MQRTCKTKIQYDGKDVKVGDKFEVEDQHVDLLLKTGHIEPDQGEDGYVAREMTEEEAPGYRTRDMRKKRG